MSKRKFDFRTIMMILILFLGNIAIVGIGFYTVTMTQMYSTYEEWVVNLTMSIPGIFGMISCLACGKISDKVDKKWLFLIGMILFAITGTNLGGLAYSNNLLLIGASAFNGGICYGMVSVSAVALISDYFEDEGQRSMVMGWYNGAMALVGAVLSFCYGIVATIDWKMAASVNWSAAVVAVLGIIFLPACPPKRNAGIEGTATKIKGEKGWAKNLIPIVLAFFFVSFAMMSVMQYIDLFVTANNLGDASLTGLFGSVQTIASFLACTFFGVFYKKVGVKISIPAYFLLALSVFIMFIAPSKATLLLGSAIMGASWGTVYTYWFFRTTVVVPQNMVGTATGIVTTANSLSYLPMAYVVTGLMGAMHTDNFRDLFPFYIVIVLVVLVGAIFLNGRKKPEAQNG